MPDTDDIQLVTVKYTDVRVRTLSSAKQMVRDLIRRGWRLTGTSSSGGWPIRLIFEEFDPITEEMVVVRERIFSGSEKLRNQLLDVAKEATAAAQPTPE